jgi:hypothetical protein
MGKGGGSSRAPSQQTVTQTNLPEYARPYFENLLNRGQAESYRQYTPYGGERIAEMTPGQTQAQTEALGMQTPGQFRTATGGLGYGSGMGFGTAMQGLGAAFTDPTQMMSPYMQGVVDIQKRQAMTDAQKQQLSANLGAARQGTYGGARQLLAMTEREKALGERMGDIQAKGLQDAYSAAAQRGQMLGQLGMEGLRTGMTGAEGLGKLGTAEQAANLQRIQAQAAAGAEQREYQQQMLDTAYADFLRQRDYPMEQLSYYSSLLRGIPVQMGSTQTSYAPPPSMVSQLAGAGTSLYGASKLLGMAQGGLATLGLHNMTKDKGQK